MDFDFNLYSTPLLFGFVQAWIYAGLFFARAYRSGRLSDWLFGALLIAMSFEIWEYMLGFAGIEILWTQMEFFPRNFGFLLPQLAFFYLKTQFNSNFRFQWTDLQHLLPFLIYAAYHIGVYSGGVDFVEYWKQHIHLKWGIEIVEFFAQTLLEILYFWWAYRLYKAYVVWSPNQFSNIDSFSFRWYRNFIAAFLLSSVFGWLMTVVDVQLELDFWHDWWDELFNAGLIYYLSITGYAQLQPRDLVFKETTSWPQPVVDKPLKILEQEVAGWKRKIETIMNEEQLYLLPELTLSDLARRLGTNASIASAVINKVFGKNFNDFVNGYRVEAVKKMLLNNEAAHLSLLGIAMDCGFHSKSTFNRAFKKATGMTPSEYLEHSPK